MRENVLKTVWTFFIYSIYAQLSAILFVRARKIYWADDIIIRLIYSVYAASIVGLCFEKLP